MSIDTTAYKAKLEDELERVTDELKTLGVHNPDNPDDWVATPEDETGESEADENIVADRIESLDERVSTLALLETEYNNINVALKKIEGGTFGICEVGGEAIEPDRLDALPSARTCIAHKEEEAILP